jgi:trk system potassium uptake protein TrkH
MEILGAQPGRRLALYFLITIAVGTILLCLPMSSTKGPLRLVDALFTATSAVCVTGLTVVDTGQRFTLFGQSIVLILIQLGGLGIMSFATAAVLSLGAKLSFSDRLELSQSLGSGSGLGGGKLLKAVFITTAIIELIGAALLFVRFRQQFPFGKAVFVSVFHSVSAFCNAGFSTFSNSLIDYSGSIYMILVFAILIISGGLGFLVIREVFYRLLHPEHRLSLHSKLCLTVSGILLLLGTIILFTAEQPNILGGKGLLYSISNSFFQSVTSRTAGFNTIPQSGLTEAGILVTMILMFIGGCPGSTAGGIKTTTFAIILILVYKRFLGYQNVSIFRRTVSNSSIIRAVTVLVLSFLVILILFAFLMFAEEKTVSHMQSLGWFVELLFEAISAFGTVGLSLGVTSHLHELGKIVLIILMFTGRLGPLALALAMGRPPKPGEVVYVEEEVMVG